MEDNIYKQARLAAAKNNPNLKTVEKAHHELYIHREKLLMIEQEDTTKRTADPSPDEVARMVEKYEAPELRDYYCTHQCPLGKKNTPLKYDSLGNISASLMSALYFLYDASDRIHKILEDTKISESERADFINTLEILKNLSYSADCLELWAQKNGYTK